MELPQPSARRLGAADSMLLARFRCSTGAWFEDEVERFVRRPLLRRDAERRPHTGHTVVGLELPRHGLVAVGAHEEDLLRDGGALVRGTLLVVAAVAVGAQGAAVGGVPSLDADGRPVTVGRYLLAALIADARRTDRAPVFRAVVARENARSLALCRRSGLVHVVPDADARFVQCVGVLGAS